VTIEAPEPVAPSERVGTRTKAVAKPELVDAFFTQEEAAELARCHPRTLRRRVESDGFPPPVKFGSRILYRRNEVFAYIRRKMDARSAAVHSGA
jgi:predicted DNA-binding transcriptional regulator AlpA